MTDMTPNPLEYPPLRALLERWQELEVAGWDNDTPDPDSWRALQADVFTVRAAAPADNAAVLRLASTLEASLEHRLELEEHPEDDVYRGISRFVRRRVLGRKLPPLRESRRTMYRLTLLRLETAIIAGKREAS